MTGKEIKKYLDWNHNSFNHIQMHDKKNQTVYWSSLEDETEYVFKETHCTVTGAGISCTNYLVYKIEDERDTL